MATQTIVEYVDDLSGEKFEDGETVSFSLDGKGYEIDLATGNAERFREALAPYIRHGRTAGQDVRRAASKVTTSDRRAETAAARHWLREHGYTLSDRGRIRDELWDAYRSGNTAGAGTAAASPHRTGTPATTTVTAPVLSAQPSADPFAITDDGAPQDEGQGIINTDDPSDETVKVWHEAKGYKIPKSGQVSGLMRHRYAKHAGVTS